MSFEMDFRCVSYYFVNVCYLTDVFFVVIIIGYN